jgi:hypothetical protein
MTLMTTRRLIAHALLVFLISGTLLVSSTAAPDLRSLRGKIYFSNNTPSNLGDFPVELVTRGQNRRVAETTLSDSGDFVLSDIKPGRYVLKITNPGHCTLLYRVDLRSASITNVRIVMDAECAHTNGKLSDLPKN